jgi:hypothetical protein
MGGRVAHATTKATDCIRKTGGMQDAHGVWEESTPTQPDTEQERPVLAAHVGRRRLL